jgi:hypothetical protein
MNLRNVMFVPVVKFLLRSPFCLRRKIVWKCVDAEVQFYIRSRSECSPIENLDLLQQKTKNNHDTIK